MDAREAVVVSLLMTSHAFMLRPDFADTTSAGGPRRSFVRARALRRARGAPPSRKHPIKQRRGTSTASRAARLARALSRYRTLETLTWDRLPPNDRELYWDAVTEATRVRQWSVLGRTRLLTAELNNRTPAFANSSSDVCGVR